MADSTIQKFTLIQLTGANAYAAMLASQAAAAASATAAAASAASAASAVNTAVSGTVNTIAKFSGTNAVRNSTISDDGTTVSVSATYLQMSNAAPSLVFHESDAGTDGKRWQMSANSGALTLYTTNDANSASQAAWQVTRSGNSVTQHQWFVGGNERLSITDSTIYARSSQYQLGYGSVVGVHIELGTTRTTDNYSLIDFHAIAGGATDYEARIIRLGGANGTFDVINTGTGAINIANTHAGDINLSTTNSTRMRIYADGGVQVGGTFGTSPGAGRMRAESGIKIGENRATISHDGVNLTLETTAGHFLYYAPVNTKFIFHIAGTSQVAIGVASIEMSGTKVVGTRDTGWTAMTGTANKNTAYDTASVTLAQLAGRVMSLQAALTTHGLIGA